MKKASMLVSVVILAVSVASIGYLVYPSIPVAVTSVRTETIVSTVTSFPVGNTYEYSFSTALSTCYYPSCQSCTFYSSYPGVSCYTFSGTTTSIQSELVLVYSTATSEETTTFVSYPTSLMTETVPPYAYLLIAMPSTALVALAVLLIIAVVSFAFIVTRRRTSKSKQLQVVRPSRERVQELKPAESRTKGTAKLKFCRECGAKIPTDSIFCEECGADLQLVSSLSGSPTVDSSDVQSRVKLSSTKSTHDTHRDSEDVKPVGAKFSGIASALAVIGVAIIGGLYLEVPALIIALYGLHRGEGKAAYGAVVLSIVTIIISLILGVGLLILRRMLTHY